MDCGLGNLCIRMGAKGDQGSFVPDRGLPYCSQQLFITLQLNSCYMHTEQQNENWLPYGNRGEVLGYIAIPTLYKCCA